MSTRYAKSEAFLDRARRRIPLGTQTFSKSFTQFPLGVSPYFTTHARGSQIWDVDGNQYTDFINALCSVTLGYADPDVTEAVKAQIDLGTIYSLTHTLECEVAEQLCAMVPSAEMVRFGKNGSDATAGAVRVARAYTGRDIVLACGYHGWQDWYIGSTLRHKGVPGAVRNLTKTFAFNDLPGLERLLDEYSGQVAAIIMEPMNVQMPEPGFLAGVRDAAHKADAILIFDETITGFRYANGGAQEFFGVTPDLTTLGKGIANGFPLSAVCGRRELMMEMEEIFFSFTMGGETMSLAAAKATLAKLTREPVVSTMTARGQSILDRLQTLIVRHNVGSFLKLSGHPTWSFANFSDTDTASMWEIKTLFMQEMLARGILTFGTHNISYAHSEADIDRLMAAYDEVLPMLKHAVDNKAFKQMLKCDVLVPLFRVR